MSTPNSRRWTYTVLFAFLIVILSDHLWQILFFGGIASFMVVTNLHLMKSGL